MCPGKWHKELSHELDLWGFGGRLVIRTMAGTPGRVGSMEGDFRGCWWMRADGDGQKEGGNPRLSVSSQQGHFLPGFGTHFQSL